MRDDFTEFMQEEFGKGKAFPDTAMNKTEGFPNVVESINMLG